MRVACGNSEDLLQAESFVEGIEERILDEPMALLRRNGWDIQNGFADVAILPLFAQAQAGNADDFPVSFSFPSDAPRVVLEILSDCG